MDIDIPGFKQLHLAHLVLDYNGTLAYDGELLIGVREQLRILSDRLRIHVVTADTFGKARGGLEGITCELVVLPADRQDIRKCEYIRRLGAETAVCVGNGRNDRLMLKEAALGIAVVLEEGAAMETLLAAHIVCTSITSALGLLLNPLRLVATLRC